jgi:hypothetical protein
MWDEEDGENIEDEEDEVCKLGSLNSGSGEGVLMKWDVTEMAETGTYLLLRDTKEMPR